MNRLWYSLAALILLIFAIMLWVRRDEVIDALNAFGRKPDAPQVRVPLREPPDMPIDGVPQGSSRLRHIVGSLLKPGAIAYEAILKFDSDEAFHAFLKDSGRLSVLGSIPAFRMVRVGYGEIDHLNDIPDEAEAAPNYLVQLPIPPDPQGPGIQDSAVPFSNALSWLGVENNATWGEGRKIAIIDTGIVEHPTFGDRQVGEVQDFVGEEVTEVALNGHGTAVASVVAGNHPAAPGVAPAAEVLNFRVADANGNSDSFTLAEGILAAVEAGADVINISLGSSGDSSVVKEAVEFALESGSVIVAAAGNSGSTELTFPAAYEGVISVGSVDALGQHLSFSNTSERLNLSAPGYAVPAAWPDEQVIQFSGTSASAPFVSGAIAAVMSWYPNLSGQKAYEILLAHANEAGGPGQDSIFGEGILNVGRALKEGTPGIYDGGIASHFYAGDLEGSGREILQLIVENRGTEVIRGGLLAVETPLGPRHFTLEAMKPGAIATRKLVVDTRLAELEGAVHYHSTLTLPDGFRDGNASDNQMSSSFPDPSTRETGE